MQQPIAPIAVRPSTLSGISEAWYAAGGARSLRPEVG